MVGERGRVCSDAGDFARLEERVRPHEAAGRTKSAAFLIWFLQAVYRLGETEAQDAVCDRTGDVGIDALVVDEERREIVVFQAKRRERLPATQGDADLREFVGSLARFQSAEGVRAVVASTRNGELRRLLEENDIADKVEEGYGLRPIFVANVAANEDATEYVRAAAESGVQVDLWDLARLAPVLGQLEREWFIEEPATLQSVGGRILVDGPKRCPHLVCAAIKAADLVKLPGIADTRIFAQDVRLGLGRTRVNKEIVASVRNQAEHGQFLAFHNGLTIVAKELRVWGSRIKMAHYSVCNGCQSLRTFYENRRWLTDDLEILVRFVRVGEDNKLTQAIAYRTNNQNAISLRALRSNDQVQVQLKGEFDELFGDEAVYGIKPGEEADQPELTNEYAGQLLLALYVREPWSSHQKYRVFDDREKDIFRYGIQASHIRLAQLIDGVAREELERLGYERMRKYALTRFMVVYLIGEVLRQEEDGKRLLGNPKPYLKMRGEGAGTQQTVMSALRDIAFMVVQELSFYVKNKGGEGYDYKSELKSEKEVKAIADEVLKGYLKDVHRGRQERFALPRS